MNVLVCIKRVPAPGARINLTDDEQHIDTRHLGFTMSPHDECAVEEAVRMVTEHGGSSTVLSLGPPEADEQVRQAISMGVDHGVLLEIDDIDWEPQATASAITEAITTLTSEGTTFDLVLFGNESPDAGNYQVGIRVAYALGLPIVSGIKGIEFVDGGGVRVRRQVDDGFELYELTLPAAVAVKEGLNLPRYPAIKGRMRAKKASVRTFTPDAGPGGLRKLRLRQPREQKTETTVLGHGPEAATAVADLLEELGVM
ncbi:MAG: electron transfer flavoprotein subunit beta/FixA family protein [Actinobacteria bacterium]|nr:electron transfer flavoprotein subunit beta/FixA family protein [Actinomycetota bacterium]